MKRICLLVCVTGYALTAGELKVAVAANFTDTIGALAPEFEKQSGHKVVAVFGATGKFYLQIKHGAPFEVFLAADIKHPSLLESEGLAVAGTRFTYAVGKLVLWSAREGFVDASGKVLESSSFKNIALANPDVAPYGRAAQEYLVSQNYWDALQGKVVLGQDIGQTFVFVKTGSAELGFVALSQIQQPSKKIQGSYYIIPQKTYKPLEQQAIQIKESKPAAQFLQFLKGPTAQKTIRAFGYESRP